MEIPSDLTPALVNLITNDWALSAEAVPATLIDLAARRLVHVEEVGPDEFIVRKASADRSSLNPYESQVLARVESLMSDGVVPCQALESGDASESARWFSDFDKAVTKEAKERGFARDRWSRLALFVLGAAALPAAIAATTGIAISNTHDPSKENSPLGWLALAFFMWFGLMSIVFAMRAIRETPAGLQEAARWLGLRRFLQDYGDFSESTPASVALWDRYLSYAMAMEVCQKAARAVPFGPSSPKSAWSAYGGRWRRVKISYPKSGHLAWGKKPRLVLLAAIAWMAAAGFAAYLLLPILVHGVRKLLPDLFSDPGWLTLLIAVGLVMFSVMILGIAGAFVRGAALLVLSLTDLSGKVEVNGRVLRTLEPGHYAAIDDGKSDRVKAWVLPPVMSLPSEGSVITAQVSRRLRYVYALQQQMETAAASRPKDAPAGAAAAIQLPDAATVSRLVGREVSETDAAQSTGAPGTSRAYKEAGQMCLLMNVLPPAEHPATWERSLGGLLSLGRQEVPDLGQEAVWYAGTTLVLPKPGGVVSLLVAFPGMSSEERLEVAKKIAPAIR